MNFNIFGVIPLVLEQVARLTRDEQKAVAQNLGVAVATLVSSSSTRIDDIAVKGIALPFAKDFIESVEARL